MRSYLDPEVERRLRPLIDLRNRIAHADLRTEPWEEDVSLILTAIVDMLAADDS